MKIVYEKLKSEILYKFPQAIAINKKEYTYDILIRVFLNKDIGEKIVDYIEKKYNIVTVKWYVDEPPSWSSKHEFKHHAKYLLKIYMRK